MTKYWVGFLAFLSSLVILSILVLNGIVQLRTDFVFNDSTLSWLKNSTNLRLPKPVNAISENVNKEANKNTDRMNSTKQELITKRPRKIVDYEQGHVDKCKNSWQKNYTKLHRNIIENGKSKFNIFVCSGAGWGNRLRDLLTLFHFSVISKRVFIIYCNSPSPLDKYLAPRNIKWNYKVNETNLSVKRKFVVDTRAIENPMDPKIYEKLLNYSVLYITKLTGNPYQWNAKYLKYDFPVWPNIKQMMGCSFYYLFKKTDLLQNKLDQWKQQLGFNDNLVIGIHVRQGDSVFRHNRGDKRFKSLELIDIGFKCAEQIQKKIEEKYKTKKVIWFLAADSERLKNDTKQKYGKKVRCISGPIEHVGHSTKGNEDAGHLSMFLDYFLLQESDFRLYTGPSTFDDAVEFLTLGSRDYVGRSHRTTQNNCEMPSSLRS